MATLFTALSVVRADNLIEKHLQLQWIERELSVSVICSEMLLSQSKFLMSWHIASTIIAQQSCKLSDVDRMSSRESHSYVQLSKAVNQYKPMAISICANTM